MPGIIDINEITAANVHTHIRTFKSKRAKDTGGVFTLIPVSAPKFMVPPGRGIYRCTKHTNAETGISFDMRSFVIPNESPINEGSLKGAEIIRAYLFEVYLNHIKELPEGGIDIATFKTNRIKGVAFYSANDKVPDYEKGALSIDVKQGLGQKSGEPYHTTVSLRNGQTIPNSINLDDVFKNNYNISAVFEIKGIKIYQGLEGNDDPKIDTKTSNIVLISKAAGAGTEDVNKMVDAYAEEGNEFGEQIEMGDIGTASTQEALPSNFYADQQAPQQQAQAKVVAGNNSRITNKVNRSIPQEAPTFNDMSGVTQGMGELAPPSVQQPQQGFAQPPQQQGFAQPQGFSPAPQQYGQPQQGYQVPVNQGAVELFN